MRTSILLVLALCLGGCTTPIVLPAQGTWHGVTELGPVTACKGGSLSFDNECHGWPLSLPSVPPAETHYAELRAKAATQYHTDPSLIVLKDITVDYLTEVVGTIRGWESRAIAGKLTTPPSP